MKTNTIIVILFLACSCSLRATGLFVEAESFTNKGGWVVDQQFMDQMGSPYLMAHGMGEPVANASTQVVFPETGTYYVYVRTFNWTSPWQDAEGPGKFKLSVDGKTLSAVLGDKGKEWMWQEAGKVSVKKQQVTVTLHDLSGFNGRCDAIYFTTEQGSLPPSSVRELETFRREALQLPDEPATAGKYDLVVVGGGIAGISAAVGAARLGCKVALINNRPVLGGNNSSEVRVHLGGRIEAGPYQELGNLQKEFGPTRGGNAQPAEFYEDDKKTEIVANEPNITLFANYNVMAVEMDGQKIRSVFAKHIENGTEQRFEAPLFADCTGDGTVGYLAGADYRMGREGRDEFGETTAPEQADKLTMGASVQWYSVDNGKPAPYPFFNYGVAFNDQSCEKVMMG
ncbi:MAG: FAD-dependent oxidoreductase, partial [Tannerella sp.]|nr:FAD-dependent oxidoreductase [Tannerella sp.]